MKSTILIKEVQYSNQANTVLGMTKMAQVTTTKIVTIIIVNEAVWLNEAMAKPVQTGCPGCDRGVFYLREAALGKSPPAQNWMRMSKKEASAATMAVHPATGSVTTAVIPGEEAHPAIRQDQHQKPRRDRPSGRHNRCNYRRLGKQWSFRKEFAGQPRHRSRRGGRQ